MQPMDLECGKCVSHPDICYRSPSGDCVYVAPASRVGEYVIVCRHNISSDRTIRYPPLNSVVFNSREKAEKYLAVYAEIAGLVMERSVC
ncbi:MAG TPA: hypothetical protein O0X89_01245 [Methanocorpusculum sp.]|nr:hypothetical protein [Methanocorpusculum sp.]